MSQRLSTMVAFWDGEGQGLSLILALILALSLISSLELPLAFFLGLFLYICLDLDMPKEAPEVKEHMELNEDEELDKWDVAFPTKVSVESAIKNKEKEESVEEDMGILIKDVWAISQYEFDHFEKIYHDDGCNRKSETEEKRDSEEAAPAQVCSSSSS